MPRQRIRLTHKDLKEPDRLSVLLERAQGFLRVHRWRLIGATAFVAAAVAVFVVMRGISARRAARHAQQFYDAFMAYREGDYADAEQRLGRLIRRADGEPIGRLARFYLGMCYLKESKNADARRTLEAYLKAPNDPTFRGLALIDIAEIEWENKRFAQAAARYHEAAGFEWAMQDWASLAEARVLAQAGKKEEAVKLYRAFLKRNPYSSHRDEVVEALARMGFEAEPHDEQSAPKKPSGHPVKSTQSGTSAAGSQAPAKAAH